MADDPTRELYGVPLADFIETRKTLVAGLKEAGEADRAAELAKAKKPKLSAWAVNQIVRSRAADLEALVAATEEAAEATDAAALRTAGSKRQEIISSLTEAALEALDAAGHAAGATARAEIAQTLSATSEPDSRELVMQGALVEPLSASGFGGLGALPELDEDDETESSAEEDARRAELHDKERALADARKTLASRRQAVERARSALDLAEAEVATAARTVEKLEDEVIDLKGRS